MSFNLGNWSSKLSASGKPDPLNSFNPLGLGLGMAGNTLLNATGVTKSTAGNIAGNTAMGAATGALTAGPVGALIGGGVGLLTSGISEVVGKGKGQKPVQQKTSMPQSGPQPLTKTPSAMIAPSEPTISMPDQKSYALSMLRK